MLSRPNTNILHFGSTAQQADIRPYGTAVTTPPQAYNIEDFFTTQFQEGCRATSVTQLKPPLSWENGARFAISYVAAYLMQQGIPQWSTNQEYFISSKAVASDGFTYESLTGTTGSPNSGNTPVGDATNWRLSFLSLNNTVVFTPTADYHPATKKYVDDNIITTTGFLSTENLLHAQDQKTPGTAGGSSISGTQTRILNTILTNSITGASLSTNQITLPQGSYHIEASATCFKVDQHKALLYNATDASNVLIGTSENSSNSDATGTRSFVSGDFTINSSKDIELRHYTNSTIATSGLGVSSGSGLTEVYADIKIWKVG